MEIVAFSPTSRFLKWPLGRVLVVAFFAWYILLLKLFSEDRYVEEAYIAFHFGIATGLACWAVLSTDPGWLRRLGIALLLTLSSGIVYPHNYPGWLSTTAVIGVYSGLIFAVTAAVLLLYKWLRRRRSGETPRTLQFGVKNLLWLTLLVVPLALLIRAALPRFSMGVVNSVLAIGIDTIVVGLATRWIISQNTPAGKTLWGRVALSALIAAIMGYTMSESPLGSWGPFDWYTYQFLLWLLLTAGHLLPRLDRYEVVIVRFGKDDSPEARENGPVGAREKSPDGARHVSPGQRPGVEGMSLYNEP